MPFALFHIDLSFDGFGSFLGSIFIGARFGEGDGDGDGIGLRDGSAAAFAFTLALPGAPPRHQRGAMTPDPSKAISRIIAAPATRARGETSPGACFNSGILSRE